MSLLSVVNLQHSYGSRAILAGATLTIHPGEKVGLVGRNGGGKTTLMKAMLGVLKADAGTVQIQRGARVGYLSQDPTFDPDDTVRDAAEGAFDELHALHVTAHELYEKMAHAEGAELDRLLKQQAQIDTQIEAAGGYAIDHLIDATLHGLGFTDDQFTLHVKNLSGGQKNRLGLARLLLEQPDLLLLDEPTNHLDIAGRKWLEEFLATEYPGAVLVVSHDRWLLDRVVNRIVEVEVGTINEYPGNYAKYIEIRRERHLTAARTYDKQQDRIRQEEQFIRRYKAGQRAKQARGRETRLERFKRDEVLERPIELDVMKLRLPKAPRSGEQVVIAEGISKQYGDCVLFRDLDLTIMRGERIGIIGPNGVGKTTLVKCLLGELPIDSGTVRLGSRLAIGHYRQTHEHLDQSLTVWEYLQRVIVNPDSTSSVPGWSGNTGGGGPRASEQQARDLAGAFLFSGNEQDKVLGDLSGGERSRAVLAGLVGSAKNLLILDEPSNHLDIPSAERLEQALSSDDSEGPGGGGGGGYEGTLLLITHDRALLQATCEKMLIFEGDGNVRVFHGRYRDWEEFQTRQSDGQRERAAAGASRARTNETKIVSSSRPSKRAMEDAESRVQELSRRIAEIDAQMADPQVFTDGERCRMLQRERTSLTSELEQAEAAWMRLAEAAME